MNKILIVTDFPSSDDLRSRQILSGQYGRELVKMLHEVGITFTECDLLQLTNERPYKNDQKKLYDKCTAAVRIPNKGLAAGIETLRDKLDHIKYSCIIALGDTALWALTGECGIGKWRGSFLEYGNTDTAIIPTYHPREIMRNWQWRFIAVHDLGRIPEILKYGIVEPKYNFTVRPDFQTTVEYLENLLAQLELGKVKLSVDLETRAKHIACIGFATSKLDAFCIPFMCTENPEGYWDEHSEFIIVSLIIRILTHRNVQIIGQNFLYDLQYIARYWGIIPVVFMDTMITHATCYPGLQKGLDFLSSLYCEYHKYWKDESKDWSPKLGEEQLWIYNCKDCVTTFEISDVLETVVKKLGLEEPVQFENDLIEPVLYMMLNGTRIHMERRNEMMWELIEAAQAREQWMQFTMGDIQLAKTKNAAPWYRSAPQLKKLFYEVYQVPVVRNRKTGRPTVDDNALKIIAKREPLLAPLCDILAEYRSINVFLNTFVKAPLDKDLRMRCSYNPVGTETFRFNSSEDAFGYGTNLQNIPKGG